jgi:hypothetical protein
MDGWWRDVGDDGDKDLLQIPVPAGCHNGVSGSESWFLMVAAQRKSIWEKRRTPAVFNFESNRAGDGGPHDHHTFQFRDRVCGHNIHCTILYLPIKSSSGKLRRLLVIGKAKHVIEYTSTYLSCEAERTRQLTWHRRYATRWTSTSTTILPSPSTRQWRRTV